MVLYCDATNVQGQVATLRLTTPTTDKCVMATTRNGNPGHKNPLTREKAKMPYVNTSHFGHHAGRHTQAMYIALCQVRSFACQCSHKHANIRDRVSTRSSSTVVLSRMPCCVMASHHCTLVHAPASRTNLLSCLLSVGSRMRTVSSNSAFSGTESATLAASPPATVHSSTSRAAASDRQLDALHTSMCSVSATTLQSRQPASTGSRPPESVR